MDASLNSFLSYLETQLQNHAIYVWGAQGQDHTVISEKWINARETSATNAANAIKFWEKQVAAGFGNVLRAFDCSGLAMYYIQNLTRLSTSDLSANGLKRQCAVLKSADVKRGDWVFRTYTSGSSKGNAYHIGFVVDDARNVIEAKGRSYGVYKSAINATGSYWNAYGRPKYFAKEIEAGGAQPTPITPPATSGWVATRVMKMSDPLMRGQDVTDLQKALLAKGYSVGTTGADGIFGAKAATAVQQFQTANKLLIDGRAGKDTVTALGGIWKGSV